MSSEKTVSEALSERQKLQEQTAKVRKRVKEMIASSHKEYKSSGFANTYPTPQEVSKPAKDDKVIVVAPDSPHDKRMICRVVKTSPLTVRNIVNGDQFAVDDTMKILA